MVTRQNVIHYRARRGRRVTSFEAGMTHRMAPRSMVTMARHIARHSKARTGRRLDTIDCRGVEYVDEHGVVLVSPALGMRSRLDLTDLAGFA